MRPFILELSFNCKITNELAPVRQIVRLVVLQCNHRVGRVDTDGGDAYRVIRSRRVDDKYYAYLMIGSRNLPSGRTDNGEVEADAKRCIFSVEVDGASFGGRGARLGPDRGSRRQEMGARRRDATRQVEEEEPATLRRPCGAIS